MNPMASTRWFRPVGAVAACLVASVSLQPPSIEAQSPAPSTEEVFRRWSPAVVKVEIIDRESGAAASVGSGFFVRPGGEVVTNYHVVADRVFEPDQYTLRVTSADGAERDAELLAVDVVGDLALLRAEGDTPKLFIPAVPADLVTGQRLYSLGHPLDLALSIAEGTFNGLMEHAFNPQYHFTGTLNPGVSGGPAITVEGGLAGVNVSALRGISVEQAAFLVPAEAVPRLLDAADAQGTLPPEELREEVGRQLVDHQERFVAAVLSREPETRPLGPYSVPTTVAAHLDCSGDAFDPGVDAWEAVDHDCYGNDQVFISGTHSTGLVAVEHRLLRDNALGRVRFTSLYGQQFNGLAASVTVEAGEDDVTPYRCYVRNVEPAAGGTGGLRRMALCARRYRHFPELHDLVIRVAPLGTRDHGLVSSLALGAVSMENGLAVIRRFASTLREEER